MYSKQSVVVKEWVVSHLSRFSRFLLVTYLKKVAKRNKKLENIVFVSGQIGASSAKKYGGIMTYRMIQQHIPTVNMKILKCLRPLP